MKLQWPIGAAASRTPGSRCHKAALRIRAVTAKDGAVDGDGRRSRSSIIRGFSITTSRRRGGTVALGGMTLTMDLFSWRVYFLRHCF